jgi:hypothetical protein
VDSATLSNAPREVSIAGKTYMVSALELGEWGKLQAWLRDHAKDPVVAAMESLNRARASGVEVTPEDRKALLEDARSEAKVWPPRVGSGAWLDLLTETDGASAQFLRAVLRKHQPDLTDADADRLCRDASPEESWAVIRRALGYVPVPKAEGAGETPTPPPSPTTGADSPAN